MRGSKTHGLAFLLLWLVGSTSLAEQADQPSFTPAAIRWQILPQGILGVRVGPDGRIWYQLDSNPNGRSDDEVRRSLESEYRQSSPQISGAALALFEPNGRVWFYAKAGREVWGYDGQQWIERKASAGSRFCGKCPTRGEMNDNLANRFVGGRAWLREQQGIHVFDGQGWIFTAVCPPLNTLEDIPRFSVSPN